MEEFKNWLPNWEINDEEWDIPDLGSFLEWKQAIEVQVEGIDCRPRWSLISQTFFLAGLSISETVGTLSEN